MLFNVPSFYPLYVEQHFGKHVSSAMSGVALGCFQIAGTIFTPVHSITISKMGRKNSILFGTTLILVTNTAFGALSLLPDIDW